MFTPQEMSFPIIILIIIVAISIFSAVSFFRKRRAFRGRGVRVPAAVTHFSESKGRRGARTYFCTVEYMLKGERQIAACKTYNRHEVGETAEIAYLPEDPKQVMLTEDFAGTIVNRVRSVISVVTGVLALVVVVPALIAPKVVLPLYLQIFTAPSFIAPFRNETSAASKLAASLHNETFVGHCRSGTPLQVGLMIKAGADVNARGFGLTPLEAAAANNKDTEVLRLLIQAGADVNAKNNGGVTPLMFAASYNSNPEVLLMLIQRGADANAKDNDGVTPLMSAVRNNNPEVSRALIQEGADANAKNNKGETALNLALKRGEAYIPEIVSILLASGAAVSENDLESAKNNESLNDTAVIEELRKNLQNNSPP